MDRTSAKGGVRTIQLRIKDQRENAVETDIAQAIALGRHYQARLFINDYWQLAIKHRAYGVHLGQEDLDTADLSAISAAHLRLGLSTHDDIEMDRALSYRPSYIALGHIFPTQTKLMPSALRGWLTSNVKSRVFLITLPLPLAVSTSIAYQQCLSVVSAALPWLARSLRRKTGWQQPIRYCS